MVTKIKLFTSSKIKNCIACNKIKQLFSDQSLEYEEIDVVTNREERRRMFKKTHSFVVPIIEIGDDFFIGFSNKNSFLIIESLKKYGLWTQKTVVPIKPD
jgi:glutaredoxin